MTKPDLVILDIIGTCFSLEPFRPALQRHGLEGRKLEEWFAATLRDAFALNCVGQYKPFKSIFADNLRDLAAGSGVPIDAAGVDDVLSTFGVLPPEDGLAEALDTLRAADIRIAALSNGAREGTETLLTKAGLRDRIETVLSVDDIEVFKPRLEIYAHAVAGCGTEAARSMLVATHAWDCNGAAAAGLATGFVKRGQVFPTTMQRPDVVGEDLREIAAAIVALA